jgi:hypothetical protein
LFSGPAAAAAARGKRRSIILGDFVFGVNHFPEIKSEKIIWIS